MGSTVYNGGSHIPGPKILISALILAYSAPSPQPDRQQTSLMEAC